MELRNIQTFLKAAQLKNFAKAADALGYVPSTVTMQIQQLEQELGFLLFDRIGKRVELTTLGRQFMQYANEISTISDQVKLLGTEPGQVHGTIRIGILESLCATFLLPKLRRYARAFPNMKLEIKVGETVDLFSALKQGKLDLIFILGKKIVDKDCISAYEKLEQLVFVTSSAHPLVRRRNITLKEILQESLILTEGIGLYRQALSEVAATQNLLVEPHMEINDTGFIVSLLLDGLGISLLPHYIVQKEVQAGGLGIIHTDIQLPYFWSQIFHRKNKWISPQIKQFIAHIVESD